MKRVDEIFDVRYGNQFDYSKMELSDSNEDVNFISRSSSNNGYISKVKRYNGIEPFEAGLITVTMGGSYLLASFLQPAPFYTAQNIKVLRSKQKMTQQELLFYCAAIQQNRFRYHTHSREANSTFDKMLIPEYSEIPNWVNDISIKPLEPELSTIMSLDVSTWKWFRYDKIFDIRKGFYNKKPEENINGKIPFIGATDSNNGITSFHTMEDIEMTSKTGEAPNQERSEKLFEGNCITVSNNGSVGYAFYQPDAFTCSHDVNPLYLINYKLNKYVALFLCTLIELEQFRWAYGRKWRPMRMPDSLIKLPVCKNGEPDWKFMEDYIKSLPFSSNI